MKKRTISAVIIAVITIPLLIIGGIPYAIGIGILSLLAFKEIADLKLPNEKKLSMITMSIYLATFLIMVYSNYDGKNLMFGLNYEKLSLVIMIILITGIFNTKEEHFINRSLKTLGLITVVGLGFNLMISVFNYNKSIFLYLLAITIFTDIFAYLSGMLIGKHKLLPLVSPNKSIEGSIIGTIMGTFLAAMFYYNFIGSLNIRIILITIVLSIIGQMGDLFFSAIKREYKIKDYSNLIPGHGGILDRIDSVLFVLIAYLVFRMYL